MAAGGAGFLSVTILIYVGKLGLLHAGVHFVVLTFPHPRSAYTGRNGDAEKGDKSMLSSHLPILHALVS